MKDPATGKMLDFTCAIWRYHPKTRKFELFAEGTSNPWGLDYNRQGDWFVSCCVIDHLFHMTQSGYYLRQGGPYPPMTQILPSITTERHQEAAYAGLCIYDADDFPEEYRGRLLMGNICTAARINRDISSAHHVQHNLRRRKAKRRTTSLDFLQANDAWFMPVSQKIGPDGCLYVMDWYDRYHCYQDANRDRRGWTAQGPDLPHQLRRRAALQAVRPAEALDRRAAQAAGQPQRLLASHGPARANEKFDASMVPPLQKMALDTSDRNNAHMHALWLLVSQRTRHRRSTSRCWPAATRRCGTGACGPAARWGRCRRGSTTSSRRWRRTRRRTCGCRSRSPRGGSLNLTRYPSSRRCWITPPTRRTR